MERSISIRIGEGSINHNNRTFFTDNVNSSKSADNIVLVNDDIKEVYHELFDDSLKKYNDKQTRNDRKIPDYYQKIESSKQEKLFHEFIVQVGSFEDMNTQSDDGEIAKKILIEYMNGFQERNPQLRVIGNYLHLDEESPHLHIDVVPFTTGNKRSLETKVSFSGALRQQGFKGGSKLKTEGMRWVQSEKEELSKVMERYDVKWKELGTHRPHLSVLDYKKQEREKEVIGLEREASEIKSQIHELKEDQEFLKETVEKYEKDEEWQVPEPQPMMSVNSYKEKHIKPFVAKLRLFVSDACLAYRELSRKYLLLERKFEKRGIALFKAKEVNSKLLKEVKDYDKVKRVIGKEKVDDILKSSRTRNNEKSINPKDFDFDR